MAEKKIERKVIYIDMDNVLVDFKTGIDRLPKAIRDQHPNDKDIDEVEGIFSLMDPMPGAIEAYKRLDQHHDVYILSTAPWKNHSAWADKVAWVQLYLGKEKNEVAHKRLILSHNKHLNKGDYLIDDRLANGADRFEGKLLHFGKKDPAEKRDGKLKDWKAVVKYFEKEGLL